jgi:recombinational DNA repair ATPase RecF
MFKIKTVEIDGFWNSVNLRTELSDGVNIFIGRNGSGKTTFINFLEASLTADLDLLESLQFSEIRLHLKDNRKRRKIVITKTPLIPYDRLAV